MNQKHAKNPIVPVSKKNRNTMIAVYPKYRKVEALSLIESFVTK